MSRAQTILCGLTGPLFLVALAWGAPSGVRLDWACAELCPEVQRFRVNRQVACLGAPQIVASLAPITPAAVTYIDRDLMFGETYCWTIMAITGAGDVSAVSNVVSLTCRMASPDGVVCETNDSQSPRLPDAEDAAPQ